MFLRISAHAHTTLIKARESMQGRITRRLRGRTGEEGLEAIEVVVLSVIALGIVIALGAAIVALVKNYMGDLETPPAIPGMDG